MKSFIEAPNNYSYEHLDTPFGTSVLAKVPNSQELAIIRRSGDIEEISVTGDVVVGIANIKDLRIPFLPEAWKQGIQNIRLCRAEVRAAQTAEMRKDRPSLILF